MTQLGRYADVIRTLGSPELLEKARNAKVLVVGSGGIGCELLKNLVLCGFENIETIDLDTIDVSNLNRQFLFRKQHVGHPKSEIAAQAAMKFNPAAKIHAHTGSIMAREFDVVYFKQFAIVMNALDNIAARRHVNRMCLAADIPLIESGTAGYLGQVTVIRKGVTECYECQPKQTAKQFPVCTIRHTPSTFIHCVVWAKHLFALAFGKSEDVDNVTVVPQDAKDSFDFSRKLFDKVFKEDIEELLSMTDLWKGRVPPHALQFEKLALETQAPQSDKDESTKLKDQKMWSMAECLQVFVDAGAKLRDRGTPQEFDKDDNDALDFVTAAANLRANCFDIAGQPRFDVKAFAGNIVAAIATTNAIIAGLIVVQAFHLLNDQLKSCRSVFCLRFPSNGKILMPAEICEPNSKCYVCSRGGMVSVKVNANTMTFGTFVQKLLIAKLNFVSPSVTVNSNLVYEMAGDEEDDDAMDMSYQLPKKLSDLKIGMGGSVYIEDYLQELRVQMVVVHTDEEIEEGFLIEGSSTPATTSTPSTSAPNSSAPPAETGKRKRDDADESAAPVEQPAAKVKVSDDGVLELD